MKRSIISVVVASGLLAATPVQAQDLSVKITNLTHGSYFTPLLVAAHDNATDVFKAGTSASANLQAMAEGGDISGVATDLTSVSATYVENPAAGLLAPGANATAMLNTTGTSNDHLSVVAMVLPSNDGFVGVDSLAIPTTAGTYTYYINAYDAGTEANDEIINGMGAPGAAGVPADPGMHGGTGASGAAGADANAMVHIHRGVLGDTNATGGVSDLDSTVHRWLNPVAMIELTVN